MSTARTSSKSTNNCFVTFDRLYTLTDQLTWFLLFIRVFRIGSKYTKCPAFYKHFGGLDSMTDPNAFRTYRSHIAPLYSARSADGMAPKLMQEIGNITKRMQENIGKDQAVNIQRLLRTLSVSYPASVEAHKVFIGANTDVYQRPTWS